MFARIRENIAGFFRGFFAKVFELIPGGWITIITTSFNLYALHSGGLLGVGAISGIALCFSILFILLATSKKIRDWVCRVITYYGAIGDVLMTVTLTWLGFHVGPTMGMMALFLGLNISMFFSIIRWAYFITRPIEKAEFEGREKGTASFKRRTRAPGEEPVMVGA